MNLSTLIASAIVTAIWSATASDQLQDGDIIFQQSASDQSEAISAATHSQYTHMGLIFMDSGQAYVYEAIQPVTRTPLPDWIRRGEKHHYVIKRVRPDQLKEGDPALLRKEVDRMMGKDYDWLFEWSDDRIYCSELVWKCYKNALDLEICQPRQLRDFDLNHASVKGLMTKRYGNSIPYNMQVVSPADIFDSKLLDTVKEE